MIVVDAFYLNIVGIPGLAVHLRRKTVLRVEKFGVGTKRARSSRNQIHETLKITVEREWHVLKLFGLDLPADVGAIRLEQRRADDHLNRLGDLAGCKLHVHTSVGIDKNVDVLANRLLEAR